MRCVLLLIKKMANSVVNEEQTIPPHNHDKQAKVAAINIDQDLAAINIDQYFHNHTVEGKKDGAGQEIQKEAQEEAQRKEEEAQEEAKRKEEEAKRKEEEEKRKEEEEKRLAAAEAERLAATVNNNSLYTQKQYYNSPNQYTQTNKPNDAIDSKYFANLDLNNKDTDAFSGYGSGSGRYLNRYLFIPLKVGSDKVDIKDRCNVLEGHIQAIHNAVDKYSLHTTDNGDFGTIVDLHSHIYTAALQCDSLAKEEGRPTRISEKIKKDFEISQEKLSIIKAYNSGSNPKKLNPEDIERMKDEVHSSLKAASVALDGEKDNVHEVLAKRTRYRVGAFVIFSLLLTAILLVSSIVGMIFGFQNKLNSATDAYNKDQDSLKHPLNAQELGQASDLMHGVNNQLESTHEISGYDQDFTVDGNDSRFTNNSHQSMSYNTGTATNPIWTPIHDINDGQQLAQMYDDMSNNPNNFQNQYGDIGQTAVSDLTASNSLYNGDLAKIEYAHQQSLLPQHNEIMVRDPSDGIIKDFDRLTVAEQLQIKNEIEAGNFTHVYKTDGVTNLSQADLSSDQFGKYYQDNIDRNTAVYNNVVADVNKADSLAVKNGISFKDNYISQLSTNPVDASTTAAQIGDFLGDVADNAKVNNINNILNTSVNNSVNISGLIADNNVGSLVNHSLTVPVDPANNNHIKIENNYKDALKDVENVNKFGVPIAAAGIAGLGVASIGGALMFDSSTGNKNSQKAFDSQKKLEKQFHLSAGQGSTRYKTSRLNKIEKNDFSSSRSMQSFDSDKYRYPDNVSPVNFVSPQQVNQVEPYYNRVTGEKFYVNEDEGGKLYTSDKPKPAYYLRRPRNLSSRRSYRETVNNDVEVGTIIKQ